MRHTQSWERAVEVDITIDEHFFRHTITRKRISIPYDEIGILADVDGAHAIIDANDPRRIQRDHLQSLFFGGSAVAHSLSRLLIEPPRIVLGVALDSDVHTFAHRHHSIPGDSVPCLL